MRPAHTLITGGSGTIGALLARHLLDAGARVTTIGTQERPAAHARHTHLVADLRSSDAARTIVGSLHDPPDALVALAARQTTGGLGELSQDQLNDVMAVKVWTPAVLAAELIPHMVEAGWGRVILTGGVAAHRPSNAIATGAVANSAVRTVTTALANDLAGTSVTVNCLTPGAVESARLEATREAMIGSGKRQNFESVPLLSPQEIVNVILFLLSDAAAGLSGSEVIVDGGLLAASNL